MGVILSVDQLRLGFIVLLDMNGLYHFSVIKCINSTTVVLADSSIGNIELSLERFTEYLESMTRLWNFLIKL